MSQHQRPQLLLRLLQQQHHLVLLLPPGGGAGGRSQRGVLPPPVLLAAGGHHDVDWAEAGLHARRLAVVGTLDGGDDGDGAGAQGGWGTAAAASRATAGGAGVQQGAQARACTAAPKRRGHGHRRLPAQEGVSRGVTLAFTFSLATETVKKDTTNRGGRAKVT